MCEQIRWGEVINILKSLKREKAPGPDGLLNEMMCGGGRIVEVLVDLLNTVLRSESCMKDWMRSWWYHSIWTVM